MFYANVHVAGKLQRYLVENWEQGEKIAADIGGSLSSLTSARVSDKTADRVRRCFMMKRGYA